MIDFLNESEYQRLLAEEAVANQLVENAANKASRSITPVNEGVVSFLKNLFSTSLVYYSFDKKKDGTMVTWADEDNVALFHLLNGVKGVSCDYQYEVLDYSNDYDIDTHVNKTLLVNGIYIERKAWKTLAKKKVYVYSMKYLFPTGMNTLATYNYRIGCTAKTNVKCITLKDAVECNMENDAIVSIVDVLPEFRDSGKNHERKYKPYQPRSRRSSTNEEAITKGSKKNNVINDKSRFPKEDAFKTRVKAALHSSQLYKFHTKNMSAKDKEILDAKIERRMADYFPAIKDYWMRNHCSEQILVHYYIACIEGACGLTAIHNARYNKKNISESSIFTGKVENTEEDKYWVFYEPYTEETALDRFEAMREESLLLEADQNKINDAYNKFTQIVKNMYSKFVDFSTKQQLKVSNYLSTKKDAILAKVNGENIPIEMRNYATGIHNIQSFQIPPYDSIAKDLPNDKVSCENAIKQKIMPQYKDFNVDFKQFCISFFEGGDTKINTNINALNMNDLYNYCNAYKENIVSTIQRDFNTMQNLKASANKVGNDAAQATRTDQANKAAAAQAKNNAQQAANNNASAPKQESYLVEGAPPTNPNGAATPQTPPPQAGANNPNGNPSGAATNNKIVIGKQQGTPPTPQTPATQQPQDANNNQPTDKTVNSELFKLNAYKTIAMQVLGAKMTAAATIFSDYVKIMKTHAPEKDTANAAAPTIILDNPQDTLNKVNAIQKDTDKNKQAKDINDLITEVKQKNPNFNGGVNDIAAAANAALKKQQAQQNNQNNTQNQAK